MFEFYNECSFTGQSSNSWITLILQAATPLIAYLAFRIAKENLSGLSRTQSVQIHMNLIALENEIRKNQANYKISTLNYTNLITTETPQLTEGELNKATLEQDNAFITYINSADKLASLINAQYVKKQFDKRDWEIEYLELFTDVKNINDNYTINTNRFNLIPNLNKAITEWEKQKKMSVRLFNIDIYINVK